MRRRCIGRSLPMWWYNSPTTQVWKRCWEGEPRRVSSSGISLSCAKPQWLTDELAQGAHWLSTMGCGDTCPYVPDLKRGDWPRRLLGESQCIGCARFRTRYAPALLRY